MLAPVLNQQKLYKCINMDANNIKLSGRVEGAENYDFWSKDVSITYKWPRFSDFQQCNIKFPGRYTLRRITSFILVLLGIAFAFQLSFNQNIKRRSQKTRRCVTLQKQESLVYLGHVRDVRQNHLQKQFNERGLAYRPAYALITRFRLHIRTCTN